MSDEIRPFLTWWVPWLAARGDDAPLGWYDRGDLEAAFNAGRGSTMDQLNAQAARLEQALNDLRKKD